MFIGTAILTPSAKADFRAPIPPRQLPSDGGQPALVKHAVALSITTGVKDSKFHGATFSKGPHACWMGRQDFAARPF